MDINVALAVINCVFVVGGFCVGCLVVLLGGVGVLFGFGEFQGSVNVQF